jgi:hypothetical protein
MTATGKPAQIATALFERVKTLDTTLRIEWPESLQATNPDAEATDETVGHLEVAIFYNRPAWEGVSSGALDQGLLQITVVWPKNQGVIKPMQEAASVLAHFTKGLTLFSGSTKVRVTPAPWQSSPISDLSDVRVPVTIPWTA